MKSCLRCHQSFEITDSDRSFYSELDVPEPTQCPQCREIRRLIWRNERTLYKRKCDATGKEIISVFHNDAPFPVYDNEYWYGDGWSALEYGRAYDFSRPFFEQFQELMHAVPQLSRSAINNQNCNYVNQCGWCKDCYLIFEADGNRSCMYGNNIYDSNDCMDCLHITKCELSYECIDCRNCFNLKFSQDCKSCSDSWFLKNCINCTNCFGCVNLRNKQYYIMNKPYSKEEYENIMAKIPRATIQDIEKLRLQFAEHVKTFPQKYIHGVQNEDSSGDYLNNTQRCTDCYDVFDSQDCRYVFNSRNCKMVHDMTVFGAAQGAQFCYEVHEIGDSVQKIKFSDQIWGGCAEITYSKLCMQSSKNLFGCVGLKKAQYCILNKQYTKDEWEALVPQIIEAMKNEGTWGEFFPHTMSPFAYNETVAQEYYPLEKEAAVAAGYGWRDPDAQEFRPATAELPKTIQEANDAILNEVFKCTECGKNYRLIAAELSFYKRAALPVPERCHNCRHRHRQSFRNPRTLYARACDKCSTAIQTTYAPSRLEPIYCEKCYLEAVD